MRRIAIALLLMSVTIGFGQKSYHLEEGKLKQSVLSKWQQPSGKTANQDDYDVTFYDIYLKINPANGFVSGNVTTKLFAKTAGLSEIDLNFAGNMQVDSVFVFGSAADFRHDNDIISIQLQNSAGMDEMTEVTVYYQGYPQSTGLGSFVSTYYNDKPIIWTLSEPYGARAWWPCKDIPEDKADSVDIRINVPEGMVVASNGLLVNQISENDRTLFHWKERYPITTYLVSIAAYDYYRYSDFYVSMAGDTMPVDFFIFPVHAENTTFIENYGLTNDMIKAFAGYFGEYPFIKEKYGHAEFLWGGGMEHQTCSSMGGYSEGLIAHELAHQWWGNMITCADFHNIWLNEGFATYSEALWQEYAYGMEAYHREMSYNAYKGGGTIYVDDATNVGRIFNGNLSYAKAGYVLHMLRHVVGDEQFFALLKAYYNDPSMQFGVARTDDFRQVCEQVSGLKLEKFFDQWIFGEYYPQYRYDWMAEEMKNGQYKLSLYLEQAQTHAGLFWMPVDVQIHMPGGVVTEVAWDSLRSQEFVFYTDEKPDSVLLDPDNWILKSVERGFYYASLEKGTLMINGVNWAEHDSLLRASFENRTFSDDRPFDFWDQFSEPGDIGYPDELPEPLGNGQDVPLDTLRQYSTIIWLGNNEDGDITAWKDSEIYNYLRAGGNVVLIAPYGRNFIYDSLLAYTGLEWKERRFNTIARFSAEYPGLSDMPLIAEQGAVSVFDTLIGDPETHLLFSEAQSFDTRRGIGFWKKPLDGGRYNEDGGQLVYIGASPFAIDQEMLKENLTYIIDNLLNGPGTAIKDEPANSMPVSRFAITKVYPNPFNPRTNFEFYLPSDGKISIEIFDMLGRKIRTLVANKQYRAGTHHLLWDGSDLSSGVYFVQMEHLSEVRTAKLLLIK